MPLPIYNFKWIALTPTNLRGLSIRQWLPARRRQRVIQKKALEIGWKAVNLLATSLRN